LPILVHTLRSRKGCGVKENRNFIVVSAAGGIIASIDVSLEAFIQFNTQCLIAGGIEVAGSVEHVLQLD
jgi:hypothetical protein